MLYSVFNNHSKTYDYYEAPGSFPPVAKMRKLKGQPHGKGQTFLPSALAVTVPVSAKKVGSGTEAKGVIATKRLGLDAVLPEESRPSLGWALLFLGLGGVAVWGWGRFRKRR